MGGPLVVYVCASVLYVIDGNGAVVDAVGRGKSV